MEEFMPSKMNNVRNMTEEIQGCKSTTLIAQNFCIYAKSQLSNRETNELKKIIKNYHYVCGCIITPDSSFLIGAVFTRLELHCKSPIEAMCYGASKISNRKIYVLIVQRKIVFPTKIWKNSLKLCFQYVN